MFVFDSLPEELSLLERREVKRLVMASIENTSKAAQALRGAILSGELSAVETLAKARALEGAKDAPQPKDYSLSWKGQTGALVEIKLEPHDAWGAVGTSYADGKVVEKRGELKKLPKPETRNGLTYVGSIAKVGLTQERYDLVKAKIDEMQADKDAQIERNIPGAGELKAAYEKRANELDYYQSFMEKANRNSFNKDRQPEVKKYEAEVNALEAKYPRAAKYLKWKGRDSSTSSGFNAWKAAKHLEDGGTLEEAYAIAEEDFPVEPQATDAGGASVDATQEKPKPKGRQKKDPKEKFFEPDFKLKTGGYETLAKAYAIEGTQKYWKGVSQEEADKLFMDKWQISSLGEIAEFDAKLKQTEVGVILRIVDALGSKEKFVEKAKDYAAFFRSKDEYLMQLASGDAFPSEREKSDLKTMAFEVGL